jgi:hypothetical protein
MTQPLPYGGQVIVQQRLRKLAPQKVVVSFLPMWIPIDVEPYSLVRAAVGRDYDWRFLYKLDVLILCESKTVQPPLLEQLCKTAKTVSAWIANEKKGYDIAYLPTYDSVMKMKSFDDLKYALDITAWSSSEIREYNRWLSECGLAYDL